jgi:hypothetical protein
MNAAFLALLAAGLVAAAFWAARGAGIVLDLTWTGCL